MEDSKLCIDIGGTKTIFAIVSRKGIIKSKKINTSQIKKEFLDNISKGIKEYLNETNKVINVSIAGRVDEKGKVVFCPHLPISGFNFIKFLNIFSNRVNIENDGNCFGLYQLNKGFLKKAKSGFAVVWGTGIGSSIIYNNEVYKGGGFATESGHIIADYKTGVGIEDIIGGKAVRNRYKMDGVYMHSLAEKGNKKALANFEEIGRLFGYYLSSMRFILDPDLIVIGGSFANSWKFMKDSVYSVLKKNQIFRNVKIKIAKGKFYVVQGAYFIDEKKSIVN